MTRGTGVGSAVVYVITKAPHAGQAKTRLCPPLLPDEAARLAMAFLQDTIALGQRSGADVRLICRDSTEQDALRTLAGELSGVAVHTQRGTGLGAALETAFALGLADGYDAVGVLGADSPSLPLAAISGAFDALAEVDLALGPSEDGGYYLLAARRGYPPLFRDMVWSTPTVLAETLRRCALLGLRTTQLATWFDVDDAGGLRRLREHLDAAAPDVAPRTRALLRLLPAEAPAGQAALTGQAGQATLAAVGAAEPLRC